MKVTKREQILLGVLFIILLGYGFYKFICIGQNKKINELKASRDAYSQKWEQVKAKIASKDKKTEVHKILNAKIVSKTDMLFTSIEQENIIVILDKMLKDSKLQGDVLSFSEVSSESTADEKSKNEKNNEDKNATNELDRLVSELNGRDKKDGNNDKINSTNTNNSNVVGAYKMQVTINFKGKYVELINFIKQVENYGKKIIINNVNLGEAQGSAVAGNLVLEFYGIPKLNNKEYFKWDYKKPSGKGDPFIGRSSSTQSLASSSNIVKKNKDIQYDFLMSVSPITSDLPTIMLGKSKDSLRDTYVYADNEGEENMEFYLIQYGEKYFYKYKTTRYDYPRGFNTEKEFTPYGKDIKLKIYSHKRNSGADLSGASIKFYNKTDLTVNVDIEDDDKDKPRVKINKEAGNININNL